ncbi:CHRD domain-containing protein [Actinopolymorpha alba]|uniref:CHRD domain-containing protein n=1 Tax=Actinopolymorpha alba TaxID=533267 RepID=UPI00037CCF59|nr:CHRD domain-containing protein [Actinopolymorpha alba]
MRAWCIRLTVFLATMAGVLTAVTAPANASETAAANAWKKPQVLVAVLTGGQEVPGPGDEDGRGVFVAKVKGDTLCYALSARKIETPMAAHIHGAPFGVAGGIVVGLKSPVGGWSADCITAVPDDQNSQMTLTRSELAAILAKPADFYVNVHTASFPAGAVRGQLF